MATDLEAKRVTDHGKDFGDVTSLQIAQLSILGPLKSPSPEYLGDEESASICPLLPPSPPPEFHHPLEPPLLNGKSPSPDFIQDEETAFTCPLLSSPPSATFRHPLAPLAGLQYERQTTPSSVSTEMTGLSQPTHESEVQYLGLVEAMENRSGSLEDEVQARNNSVPSELLESSSSSSSSALQENPSCVQLLSNHHYQHLNMDKTDVTDFIAQEACTKPGIEQTGHKISPDYCFLSWNWPLIRKSCFWTVISAIVAGLCIVVAMVSTVPRRCYPAHHWYHGSVIYEVFPASFQDSNRDGMGDLKGLALRADYIQSLGVRAIRLNSIFPSPHYPEHYDQVTNLTAVEKSLGTIQDLALMIAAFHNRSISVILDIPVYPYVKDIAELKISVNKKAERKDVAEKITNAVHNHRSHRSVNQSEPTAPQEVPPLEKTETAGRKRFYIDGGIAGHMKYTSEHIISISETMVEEALYFWFDHGVDGVYLKGLDHYTNSPKFLTELFKWKSIKNSYTEDKLIMCDFSVLDSSSDEVAAGLLATMDLLDVHLDLTNGTANIRSEIHRIQDSDIYGQQHYPWVHWNIGDVSTPRLATRVSNSLGSILFHLMLPGTVSIFYGDEIGLLEFPDKHNDQWDIQHLRHLSPMVWSVGRFTGNDVLPWVPYSKAESSTQQVVQVLHNMTLTRSESPSMYMSSVWKDSENLKNYAFRVEDKVVVVLERSYPRRNSFLAVHNAGTSEHSSDLSKVYYGGQLVADVHGHQGEYVTFSTMKLLPGETIVVMLDK